MSEPPVILIVAFWFPVFAVILWGAVRVFSGRWIEDDPPVIVPVVEPDPIEGAPVDADPRDDA